MKTLKRIIYIISIGLIMVSFSNCSTAQKLQKETPFVIGEVFSEKWVAGVEGGGAGTNVFIPVSKTNKNLVLDSLYFQGKAVKLEKKDNKNGLLYIGRFASNINQKEDIIMHEDPKKEYGNKPSVPQVKMPFEIKENEAIVSYKVNDATKYFKIENIKSKPPVNYMSAPKVENQELIKQ